MPTDPPSPDVIRQAAIDARRATDYALPPGRRDDPDYTALRVACFSEVLRARLAYEYGLSQVPGA